METSPEGSNLRSNPLDTIDTTPLKKKMNNRHTIQRIFGITLLPFVSHSAELIHYYDFEGDFDDRVGEAHGTAGAEVTTSVGFDGGTAATFVSGIEGGGAFDETGYVALDSSISSVTGEFSLSYWVKLSVDATTTPRGIFDFSGDGGDGPQSLFIQTGANENKLAFRVDGNGTSNALVFVDVPEDDSWFFITATFAPGVELKVYVDGVLAQTGDATGVTEVPWDFQPYLGSFNVNTQPNRGLFGSLDDFAIYSGILTEAEVANLFDSTLSPLDFDPASAVPTMKIRAFDLDGDDAALTFSTAANREYRIYGGTDLTAPESWLEITTEALQGTGEDLTHLFTLEEKPPKYFFQIREN